MGRAKDRARMAANMENLNMLRDRKVSVLDKLLPPDSSPPPSRVLRSNVDSYQLPTVPPSAQVRPDDTISQRLPARQPTKGQAKKLRQFQKQIDRIAKRAQLMSTKSTDVLDLTNIDPDIDTDISAEDNESCVPQNDWRSFDAIISVGFSGYSERTDGQFGTLILQVLGSPHKFQKFIYQMLQYPLQLMGMQKHDIEILGYEVRFPANCICRGMSIQAGQQVLVRSNHILVEWAHQVLNCQPSELPELVVRTIKRNGTMFDATFRTHREIISNKMNLDNPLKPAILGVSPQAKPTIKVTKRSHDRRKRREANGELMQAKYDTLTRREKLAQKTIQRLDTMKLNMTKLEDMMAKQHLTGGHPDDPSSATSDLPSDAQQRNDEAAHTANEFENVEQGMKDLAMN